MPSILFDALNDFLSDATKFALLLQIHAGELKPLLSVTYPPGPSPGFRQALPLLEPLIDRKTPLYLITRRDESLTAIAYVPYCADEALKKEYLDKRGALVKTLGESHFSTSIICKAPEEITDLRSWEGRDQVVLECDSCEGVQCEPTSLRDLGHVMNRCRLCDHRMKMKIEPAATEALKELRNDGDCVQIMIDIESETLVLGFYNKSVGPGELLTKFPTETPSLTFYRHLHSGITYFVYCSPDSAPVKERMTYTMSIPGLVNIIASNNGVVVDKKLEIHDGDDLAFD
ncbi:hypothetical protein BCR34DRAFT_598687 [Clohesyomyces aquaticus]|uniref:ADF-H domain-containing protein n=1 Tax=Clohesyomyces aquaticus TaxID=1231657 RepID=A0A1Y1ZYB2_9PLEO|nr:hypothetical protein BCR34DRAFT_598687 [Clohesyomyces aquaticus]